MMIPTPLLDSIDTPIDLRRLNRDRLPQLARELRAETISAVGQTGGHLGSGLGVVELTIALHYAFNTPDDRLVWDVGHQCYPHKILTGRRARIRSLRQSGGLSGFTRRSESVFDPFGAAHSSTSISAAIGFAVGQRLGDRPGKAIAVIGDGSMSAGMAYEAINNARAAGNRLVIVLNDNAMSIAPPVGGLSSYLLRLARSETDGALFESLGLDYIGPIDGHDVEGLIAVLERVRDTAEGPTLVHVLTQKGKGYAPAEAAADKYHGVQRFDVVTGTQVKSAAGPPAYQAVFADQLMAEAHHDPRIVAITAAMPSGTGLDRFAKAYPERTFDVGIAEQHAVTFAAGLAAQGMRPFCAIYSTFLQRAYDQVVHDVAIQNLPVRFAIDRAGMVGADGATHAGSFDVTYLACLPNFVVMAPADEAELVHMTHTAALHDRGPIAFRYPRGNGTGAPLPVQPEELAIGKGRIVKQGSRIAILSLGSRLGEAMKAALALDARGLPTTVADMRFAKPLDHALVRRLLTTHDLALTIEEGAIGGFGTQVLTLASDEGLTDSGMKIRTLRLPDRFQDQDSPDRQYAEAGLDAAQIIETAFRALGIDQAAMLSGIERS